MHERARPDLDSMRASELLFADQSVEAAVPVIDVAAREVAAQAVLLDPVELEVAERLAVPAADGGEAVLAVQALLKESLLGLDGAGDAPGSGDARLVHPVVQQVRVAGVDVDVAEGRERGRGDARVRGQEVQRCAHSAGCRAAVFGRLGT